MINNTIYYSPTKIYFGENQENNIGNIINEYGYKNILIIYGKNSVIKSGLLDRIIKQLTVKYYLKGGVEPNPKVNFVLETNKEFHDKNIDLILAVGGGSVIDTAKAIASSMIEDLNPIDIIQRTIVPTKFIDVATVLTLSAAGSELSQNFVLSDLDTKFKKGYGNPNVRPVFSILNPKLTYTVSKFQTANGIVDIMMHTLERFFNPKCNLEFTNEMAIGVLKTVYDNGVIAINEPENYNARANIMIAGSFAHNDLTSIGMESYLRVHQFEHIVSAIHDEVSHGEGLAILFIAWAKVMKNHYLEKMSLLAERLFDCKEISLEKKADCFINNLQKFYISIGMKSKLSELGIKDSELEDFSLAISMNKTKTIPDAIELDYELIYKIFKEAL